MRRVKVGTTGSGNFRIFQLSKPRTLCNMAYSEVVHMFIVKTFTKPIVLWQWKYSFGGNSTGNKNQQDLQLVVWYRSLN